MEARTFLNNKIISLAARARRLAQIDLKSVGIRSQDLPYAPSPAHFRAANQRLAKIDKQVAKRLHHLQKTWATAPNQQVLKDIALVERELDRARRTFDLFFDIFSQRGTSFAPSLAAHDVIAEDCYTAVRQSAPHIFRGPLLKPTCYMDSGASPATMRRGVLLNRLLGEPNPFPLVRIPYDRDAPWQAVFLHEVAHNLQADLGIWQENRQAVLKRILPRFGAGLTQIYGRWHKEIFADLAAILLGGPAAAWGMTLFLAYPASKTMTYRPGGAHPTSYLRILILAEMLQRMAFDKEANRLRRVWKGLYKPEQSHRLPTNLLRTADRVIPEVVDEIAFQTRRNLAQRALVDIISFRPEDQARIRSGARTLIEGKIPSLSPRHLVSASSYALETGNIDPARLGKITIDYLTRITAQKTPVSTNKKRAAVV
ncbi:MAG: hypothetical protein AB4050_13320 [Synechococcus sp.]